MQQNSEKRGVPRVPNPSDSDHSAYSKGSFRDRSGVSSPRSSNPPIPFSAPAPVVQAQAAPAYFGIVLPASYQTETTRLSTKGQIILPKSIRTSHAWKPGTELTVEESADGILLRPAPAVPLTEQDQVFGCLQYKCKAKTLAQMDAAIRREAKRRHDSGHY